MKIIFNCLLVLIFSTICSCSKERSDIVTSPDGKIKLQLGLSDNGRVYYTVNKSDILVFDKSFLGFTLKDGSLDAGLIIKKINHSSFNETWEQPWGENLSVENNYNELKAEIEELNGLKRRFFIVFRVFNDGFGFRYEFPQQENLDEFIIMDELTEFALSDNNKTWSIPYNAEFYEALYKSSPVSELDTVSTPLTVETTNGYCLSIHEANLTDYAAMNLYPIKDKKNVLQTYLSPWSSGEKVFMKAPHNTPWRTVIIADTPGDLLLSGLMLNLNEPCKIEDTSWIHPGRYVGIWWGMHMKKYTWEQGPEHGAKTENVIKYIDFAAKHNFEGVLVEGWNKGWEDWKTFDFTAPYSDFDISRITDYAAVKKVKLIGHHETGGNTKNYENQMDSAFAFYHKYGVNAVKTGYVGGLLDGKEMHSSQYGVRHYRKVIETAAKYQIMIDNHEPVMPTGLQRTYPNLMTQEAVRGQEWDAWSTDGGNPPEHTTIIPFTRGLAGPMDFTPVTFNFDNPVLPNTRVRTTLAKQLALFVILYSPMQMASDMIENYENNPDPFKFVTLCPTTWSKTIVPHAKIGEYITIARKDRDSENWFVGSITNSESRELSLDLKFLNRGDRYRVQLYKDGADADYKINPYSLDIENFEVTSDSILQIKMAPSGGVAIIFEKI